ncbi:MAG: branched-chain amino acid transaminase [Nitrososphaerota archaeon]|jgi:branched-chain amino acid aminotransferase|nr:branched-chain amino acid transaminase [Nitrososphaerota archaeon]MDG6942052.1 branched-chain amino acid transaminase [Nitrososphaerota archaeon]MDG6942517.1 branched-chain amino acid transaminase [Nitrososphaerota archaeon]MDG6948304.1 branched-chain amino acid transaminase [Nitrososphaerota archaeon]MDG6950230.1 branched-chain amino acid transaminase [Nitrososphaerota archaeon]
MKPQKKIWMDGKFVPWDDAKIHVLTHGLHYGMAIFEGIRAFETPEGTAIFRLSEHIERLMNSAKIYRMNLGFSAKEIAQACVDLVRNNPAKECYIRPIAFTGYGEMGLNPLTSKISVAIGSWEWGAYLGDASNRGVRATITNWVRIDSRAMPVQAKCAANYANSALAKMQAVAAGYDEAILLNSNGMVAEGPGENIFRVKDGILSTPPASSGILRGITRDTIIQFARDEKITFYRNDATKEELYTSDEVFFSGTAAGIAKVSEIDGRKIGDDGTPITDRLAELYDRTIHGKDKRYAKWLTLAKP